MHVKQYLEKHKLTQDTFAQMVGCKQNTIVCIANFHRRPQVAVAMRIYAVTNGEVTPEELMFPERHGHQPIVTVSERKKNGG